MNRVIVLAPGDLFFTRGRSPLSWAIRLFTRSPGEDRTAVNHVGVVVQGGLLSEAVIVEALDTVKRHRLVQQYGPPRRDGVAVYRAVGLAPENLWAAVQAAEGYVGRKYGRLKILAHLGDWMLGGAYLFRRLARMDKYPICSWLASHAYEAAGVRFGVDPNAASPDDMWDWIKAHPDQWRCVRLLKPL